MSNKTRLLLMAVFLLVFSMLNVSVVFAADEESLAQQAEQAGKHREAVTHYVNALQSVSEGSTKDQQLREKIISLAIKVTPPPAVPDEARRYAVRGKSTITEAKSASDFEEAAREFSKALRVAPWWAESYFNRAVAQEKAGQLNEAISSLKLYLLAAPNDPDTDKVKDQIYALEYKQEKTKKEMSTKRQAEEQERQSLAEQKASAEKLNGRWVVGRGKRYDSEFCGYTVPDIGAKLSVQVRGDKIDIYIVEHSFANCRDSWRYPHYPLNLLVFNGTIQNNRLVGSVSSYSLTRSAREKKMSDLAPSDYFLDKTYSFKAEIVWDINGNSFTMNPGFYVMGSPLSEPAKWERE